MLTPGPWSGSKSSNCIQPITPQTPSPVSVSLYFVPLYCDFIKSLLLIYKLIPAPPVAEAAGLALFLPEKNKYKNRVFS